MPAFYEKEEFVQSRVPIRLFHHNYADDLVYTVPHWHRSVEINLTLVGEATHCIGTNNVVCGPGDLCIVNSGVIHSNHAKNRQPEIQAITLQFSLAFLESWLGKDLIFCLPQEPSKLEEMRDLILILAEESRDQKEYRELRQMELAFRLMGLMSRYCLKKEGNSQQVKKDLQHFKGLLEHIETHYQEPLSLNALADRFGYSSSYLSRSFKKHIGCNFSQHIRMVRMNATVADMRNHPDKSILDCAEDHGFPNVKSFIHIFKQEYGCTPSEWRKKNTKGQAKTSMIYIDAVPEAYASLEDPAAY